MRIGPVARSRIAVGNFWQQAADFGDRFSYNGSNKAYVGVMAQEALQIMPWAVSAGRDGYLRVNYQKLGLTFQSYDAWIRSGAHIPVTATIAH
jgi:hypothetical protein